MVRGVDQHNVAVTGLSDYYPVGFFIFGAARQKRNNQEVDPEAHADAAKLSLTANEVYCRDRG
jgi:hypothetical protein